jgi:taurine dioxygenase
MNSFFLHSIVKHVGRRPAPGLPGGRIPPHTRRSNGLKGGEPLAEAVRTDMDSAYNQAAIRVCDRLQDARAAAGARATGERTLEERFPPFNRAGLGLALEYERMGNGPVSEGLLDRAAALGVTFEHLGITLGTVIHGLNLKGPMADETVQFLRDVLLERKVIFFRDQHLDEDEQVAFGRCFGTLDAFPFGRSGQNPFILEISHDAERPGTENGWHTDVTWMEAPSLGSIAQCVVVPPVGGDTLFSDSYAAYLGLPAGVQEQIQYLHGINDYRIFLGGLSPELVEEVKKTIPFGVSHPIARTHPETGKTALYIHGGFLRHESLYDVRSGEPLGEQASKALVNVLLAQHQRPEYVCRFHWEPGSIAFWDNRAVQHYAASDYYPHRRLLRRVTVSGDKPFFDNEGVSR